MPRQTTRKKGFESYINELENIVDVLSKGDMQLEETINAYQKGVELVNAEESELKKAENRIKLIIDGQEENYMYEEKKNGI